jgi:quercetin dioxygenase-like cupin family protein
VLSEDREKWKSNEAAHNHRARDQQNISRAQFVSTHCSRQTILHAQSGASVTFEPGARTAWHTHPLGQVLIVMGGSGLVQSWGGPIREIWPGDVVTIQPGEKHWHGATATTSMTHFAIQEQLGGKTAEWMEKVSDELYMAASGDE